MLRVKRIDSFMLQTFIPVFMMTFFISLFIVLMQFLWRYIDDLVGKGLEFSVIGELFFYAALTMVPLSLPLSVLLASLMTFGNLGEHFELTAMKASGISLIRVMRPLLVLMIAISIGAFFFQNNALPIAQTKMWTLLFSMRQKSPEVEIPQGVFYDQLPGINLYVERKGREDGMLYDMIIYDVRNGLDNARIIMADSGRLSFTEDKTHMFLQLYDGEQFESLRETSAGGRSQNRPYRRESFDVKELMILFDANFNRMDEAGIRSQYVGKNIAELQATVDSVQARVDSIGDTYANALIAYPRFGINRYEFVSKGEEVERVEVRDRYDGVKVGLMPLDSIFAGTSPAMGRTIINQALNQARRVRQDYEFKSYTMQDDRKNIRRHGIEMHKKFTLSFACIIFFFIGAPLGAIIRKGGIGTPLVISVILFIVYYIIDNGGYKMARDGRLDVWQGIWLSSMVLLPLGIFLTYKAVNDSALFNFDVWRNRWRRLTGKERRELERKDFVLVDVGTTEALDRLSAFDERLIVFRTRHDSRNVIVRRLNRIINRHDREMTTALNQMIEYLSNSRDHAVIAMLNNYPFAVTPKNAKHIAELDAGLEQLLKRNNLTTDNHATD